MFNLIKKRRKEKYGAIRYDAIHVKMSFVSITIKLIVAFAISMKEISRKKMATVRVIFKELEIYLCKSLE